MVARTWTDQRLADLTYWWATKLSSVEIGLKMGITKNAVIGAARCGRSAATSAPAGRPLLRGAHQALPLADVGQRAIRRHQCALLLRAERAGASLLP
jgi:hypothetical protein